MDFVQAISHCFHNYVSGRGRAARSEYWYFALFVALMNVIAVIMDTAMFPLMETGPFSLIVSLGLLLPSWAVAIRRLHDLDRTGWWVLIAFTIIGLLLLLVWFCLRGTQGPNRFGPDPLATSGA
ncbi:DUF805 domain-containing protein [Undibacter mobilis]|uniref:DUF805 domain-containing protein n=1 Tax=Undibacter mobilis TaxID=2292256 RepID=A0A371B0Q0_9BRAD|nr:DUF805 domain-containing protein [Undibacter mobilis]RDV01146.1 DUF805 domain-containing protein [Undibacter mobilis]